MKMDSYRLLDKQVACLGRLEKRDPEAIVTGWSKEMRGPIVVLSTGEVKVVPPTGHLRKLK